MTTEVTCRARYCETKIVPGRLFCYTHWSFVPPDVQGRINHSWDRFRSASGDAAREWRKAHTRAVHEALKAMPK